MLWTELLFRYFPINKESVAQQMFARFCLLLAIWLVGLLAHWLDGLTVAYLSKLSVYQALFGTSLIILFGSYGVQRALKDLIPKIRPMIKLNEPSFRKFSERLERYSYSFLPCLLIALGFVVFLSNVPQEIQQAITEGFRPHVVWGLSSTFFGYLLVGTAFWMFMSIWLAIFLISRQPLNVKLSPATIERFRDLSMLALWFSLGYFLAISIGIVVPLASVPATSLIEIALSPFLFFIAIGVIGILFPFYNIHRALLKLKQQELSIVEEESGRLLQQLDDILRKQSAGQSSEQTLFIMARLFSLQIKERRIREAQEWPIDVSFLSKLVALVLLPIIVRGSIEIFSRYF